MFTTIGQDSSIVGSLKLMEGKTITVDIEFTATIIPHDIVRINLHIVTQNNGWTPTNNINNTKCLDIPIAVRILCQNDSPFANVQPPRVDACAVYF
ncbi:Uncharacterised protein [Escherichia coli]|nr:Uncharacterised protein [Escherichia coli]